MSWTARVRHLYGRVFHRDRVDADLDLELQTYFDIQIERRMARGLTREAAQRAVRLELDGIDQVKQRVREARMGAQLETTLQDVRHAWRSLRASPGFTFFAVLTIALGLGANAAIFSLLDGVLLKSSGYPEPERIVQLWEKPPRGTRNGISGANYIDWARQSRSFTAMAAMTGGGMTYTGAAEPRSLDVAVVSAPYFDVFGVKAALGRTFAPDEDRPGKERVVVLSHRLWLNDFGGDRAIVGRTIRLDGEPYTVIGVLAGASEFDRDWAEAWVPLTFPPNPARDYHYLRAFARLKPGVSVEQARAEMSGIAANIARLYPDIKKDWGATVDRYIDRIVGPNLRLSLIVLMSAVAAVLLIGCANLANLLMARATLRSREIALRMALGAGRARLVRMLLTESLLLAGGSAAIGSALGYGLLAWITSLLPPFYFPAEASVAMDWRVLLFLAVLTVLTSIGFGLAPAIQASRSDTAEALKEGGRASSAGRGKIYARHVFVAAQVAVAFVLLVGGGLLIRSLDRLMRVDLGFKPEGIVAGDLPIVERDPDPQQLTQYITRVVEEVEAEPGIRRAAVATAVPLRGWGDGMPFHLPARRNETVGTGFKIVTPGYFETLGLRPLKGRLFDERDAAGSPPAVVVNQSFVKRYFPGTNPIGQHILVDRILPSRRGLGPETSWEIVGLVPDEKGNGLDSEEDIGAYACFAQNPVVGLGMVVRGGGDAPTLIKAAQRAIWRVNKNQVFDRPMTVEAIKQQSLMGRRLPTMLLGGFALLAMLLACAGIYGVLSFVTARRTQELGVRAALGASPADLMRLVIGGGAVPVGAGIFAGMLGAIALSRFIQSLLFGTSPIDAPTIVQVALLFMLVALAACAVPAWRAARTDPVVALRQE